MLEPTPTTRFKKDLKRFKHQIMVIKELNEVIKLLVKMTALPEKNFDHPLESLYKLHKECHRV